MMSALNKLFVVSFAALLMTASIEAYSQGRNSDLAASCSACHGAKGEGNAASNFPRIAGQPQLYLARQLSSFANGSRNNSVMTPIAKQLSQQQITELSTYYESLVAPPVKKTISHAPDIQKRGQVLAAVGDGNLGVQACANCHGPEGAGEPPTYPYLAGQHAGYLAAALGEWKSGVRNTDPSQQMNMIAKRLSDSDITALSAYFAAQPVPPPAAQRLNEPVRPTRHTAASNTSTQGGSNSTAGTSSEQSAPSSGGSQGPGGGDAGSGTGPAGTSKIDR